jgi:hypothetical protein
MMACKSRVIKVIKMKAKKNNIAKFVTEVVELGFENKYPTLYVVSKQEFEELQREHASEVESLSYEEYCAIESECWHDMLKEQLMLPWERIIPEQF